MWIAKTSNSRNCYDLCEMFEDCNASSYCKSTQECYLGKFNAEDLNNKVQKSNCISYDFSSKGATVFWVCDAA